MRLTPGEIEAERALFDEADVVLLQLEIPVETVERAGDLAKAAGATVILNPAPACDAPRRACSGRWTSSPRTSPRRPG